MRLRNSFRILTDDFSNAYKILLYRFITGVIGFSLAYVILTVNLRVIVDSGEIAELKRLLQEVAAAFISADAEYLQGFQVQFTAALKDLVALIGQNMSSIVGSVVGLCVIYLVSRFVNGLCTFAMGSVINDRMRLFTHAKFAPAYFSNLGKASLYQLVYVPLTFVYDVASVLICWFFFFYLLSFLPLLLTVFLAVTALVCLQALKLTAVSAWMPATIADGKRLGEAMRRSFGARKDFGVRFSTFLICVYAIVIGNVIAALFTVGSALLLTVPTSYLLLLCVQFVNYYEEERKKYFVSFHKIENAGDGTDVLGG